MDVHDHHPDLRLQIIELGPGVIFTNELQSKEFRVTEEEKARVKRLTDAVQALLQGKVPKPIEDEAGLADELGQLTDKVNKLTEHFHQIHGALIPLSLGKLDVEL
ncbi:MAG: hypothetical protein HQK56_20160, partial [Deltaproteobacteria bacterium]|nr:hypothetical protein [Deltaproteobacteria bacterium]